MISCCGFLIIYHANLYPLQNFDRKSNKNHPNNNNNNKMITELINQCGYIKSKKRHTKFEKRH